VMVREQAWAHVVEGAAIATSATATAMNE